ncbi:MAG TPA: hypothetical protein VFB21_22265 [Chthonomonadaceae bacterium]|nr:hypothetical protein [Chthonomonadaceae bacterium]
MTLEFPMFSLLETSLLDLLYELRETDMRLILGGGYGLYLKQRYLREIEPRTLLATFPAARSTNDLDIFLRTEILTDADRARQLAGVLHRLGYTVVEIARYYQFEKAFDTKRVKIDLLTGPESLFDRSLVRIEPGRGSRRIKPRQKGVGLHAHSTEEAIAIQDSPVEIPIEGYRTTGEQYSGSICLPHPFTYALMKLFATRDKDDRNEPDNASKHALDLYRVMAMMTEPEWETAKRLSAQYSGEPVVKEAGEIIGAYFAHTKAQGVLRLREHPQFTRDMNLQEFLAVLAELFPKQ